MTRNYPDYLYRDPLIQPQMLQNERVHTQIRLDNVIDLNVEGDMLLNAYITFIDEEIFATPPNGLNNLALTVWETDELGKCFSKMLDESRKHGWCVVQFYEEGDERWPTRWKVYSVQQFTDFIKETGEDSDGNSYIKIVGIKFEWGDYVGNAYIEELYFEDPTTHLVKFREGDGLQTFAFPDINQALMTLVFEIRQVKSQMTYSAAKPSYQHFVYGTDADDPSIDDLDEKLRGIDTTTAIGASEGVLSEIRVIKNENLDIIEPALEKLLQYFAGATRLPLSFYIGQRNRSGFGVTDVGEKTDMLAVLQKKEVLFHKYEPVIRKIFADVYGITVDDLELEQQATLEEIMSDEENVDNYQDNPSRNKELEKDTNEQGN